MKGFFVTGTDTGVGKTFVTAGMARAARARGQRVFAFKPVESGCERIGGRLVGADQEILVEAAGGWQQGELRGVYQLVQPAAPLVAAEAEGAVLDLHRILHTLRTGAAKADLVLVEGAGGWRVPILPDLDMGGLASEIGLPVVIVARATLGTINHTLLTIEAVQRDGCWVAGVVLSRRPEDDVALAASNVEQIRRRWSGIVTESAEDLL